MYSNSRTLRATEGSVAISKNGLEILVSLFLIIGLLPFPLRALDVPLTVANREAAAKTSEPITSGVPFAEGILTSTAQVRLLQNGAEIPAQFKILARWPDNSVRWLLVDFQADLPASGSAAIVLQTGTAPAAVSGITIDDQASTLTVNTGARSFAFTKTEFAVAGTYFEVASGGTTYRAVPDSWQVEDSGPMKAVVRVDGSFMSGGARLGNTLVGFRARLYFFRNQAAFHIQLTFKNNNAFGWDSAAGMAVTLGGANFSAALLPSGGSYVFGQGVEKTWDLDVPASGSFAVRDSRYNSDGSLASGYTAPRPLAVASAAYYASANAWGRVTLPLTGYSSAVQAEFDRFEKLQRAKVIAGDVENPPGRTGITLWQHLNQDIGRWNDYGDQRWDGEMGPLSGNHYDWAYGMTLQFFRTGRLPFLDMARVLAKHEIDFDIYHTASDGNAFNYQKNWESRPSHDNPNNTFGGGRPSHTWSQGYALYWLLTGDYRGKDAVMEILDGVRQYVYESFNTDGYINTNEIRIQGWLAENLVTLWRLDPQNVWSTSYGSKSVPQALKDVLKSVFDLEAAAGGNGFVIDGDPPEANLRAPLQNCYFLEPAILAYREVFKSRDAAYADSLLGLIRRMTTWLMSITYGGDTNGSGHYRPRQIPYRVDTNLAAQTEGQIPYLLMAANAAGFCRLETGVQAYADYLRPAFLDYIRYMGVEGGDTYIADPSRRTAASYNSSVYVGTESKIHGWSSRYGQYYLAAEAQTVVNRPQIRLSRQALNFGALAGGASTKAQSVVVSNAGAGTLNWTAAVDQPWLGVTPASGTGTGILQVSVNPTGLSAGLTAGAYQGTISVADPNASNSPQTIAVTLTVYAGGGTGIPFGDFATPINGTTGITGAIPVTGWVLDDIETVSVQVKRLPHATDPSAAIGPDGLVYIGDGIFVEGARPDVEAGYPTFPFNYRAGWGYMLLTNFLPLQGNDSFTLHAIATDKEGNVVTLGTKVITCDNAHATKPFGTIDTPPQGGDASGSPVAGASTSAFVNFGWVLTPQPKTVPKNGSTIEVYVDSVKVGTLATLPNVYDQYRVDVATAFPGLNNTGGPGAGEGGPVGAFFLDTTTYANGVHTIYWVATDDAGAADGIGSRYFNIVNVGAAPLMSHREERGDVAISPGIFRVIASLLARQSHRFMEAIWSSVTSFDRCRSARRSTRALASSLGCPARASSAPTI